LIISIQLPSKVATLIFRWMCCRPG